MTRGGFSHWPAVPSGWLGCRVIIDRDRWEWLTLYVTHHEMSCNVPDGHFYVFIFSDSKFYAIYNGENHFQIRGLVAKLHVFEFGGATFSTFEKTCFKCWRLLCYNNRVELKNHVFDHETQKSGLFLCYRLKINDFLSSYNQNLKIDIFTPLQQIPCYCKGRLGLLWLISWWRVTYSRDAEIHSPPCL